jgi:ketosteroid isomerase-like protein
MKKKILIFGLLLTGFGILSAQDPGAKIEYKNSNKLVSLNPNADRDLQLVADFAQAIEVDGNIDKARALLDPNAKCYGPDAKDSSNVDDFLKNWEKNYTTNLNRKIDIVQMTWRVLSGYWKGDWVSHWGTYHYTDKDSGKRYDIPYHTIAKIVDGKISDNRSYYDLLGVMLQAGFTLQPPNQK